MVFFYLPYFPLYSSPSLLIDFKHANTYLIGTDGFPGGLGHSQPPVGMYLFNQAKLKILGMSLNSERDYHCFFFSFF